MTTAADTPTIAAAAPPPMSGQASADSRVIRSLGYVTVALALAAAAGTFLVLMGQTPLVPTEEVVRYALAVNSVFVGLLVVAVGWEAVGLYQARRRGRAGARLHIRIVGLFSIVAAIPAVLVAIVASVTLHSGLDTWFSSRTHAIVDNSLLVADGYAKEHARALATDILAIKPDLERAKPLFDADLGAFQTFVDRAAAARSVLGLFLIHGDGEAIVGANLDGRQEFPGVPEETLKQAATNGGTPLLIAPGSTNLVGGVVRLDSYPDTFLYVIRQMDPTVVRYIQMITAGATEYRDLEGIRYGVQVAFAVLYLGVCLIVLLSAIWLGIGFANRLVAPIRRLIDAADQVARGNLAVEVPARSADGDVGSLSTTFNKMTSQLRGQRSQLLEASEQIDRRRRFGEAVLAGVTAGVIGIDPEGRVTIVNRMALRLLGKGVDAVLGHSVEEAVPELAPVVAAALADSRSDHRGQTVINRGGRERTINVRVTTEGATPGEYGYVITFDDITDLVTAQRSSAWADVARRIAHEIKNPLTPIQLAAERLQRRYGRDLSEDDGTFEKLSKKDITAQLALKQGDLDKCRDQHKKKEPKVTGKLVARFTVDASGRTTNVGVLSTEFKGSTFEKCVTAAIKDHVLEARKLFRTELPAELKDAVEFFDADAYNKASTLLDNVLFGKVAFGQAQAQTKLARFVRMTLDALSLSDDVMLFGLDFSVGVAGARLSAAQRQKLGIARAMLKRPDILILAEAGNALDGASQAKVVQNVVKEFKGRGIVWGLSRARFASHFDHVLVMRAGRVVEQGTFEQLNRADTALKELLSAE